jgi:cellulose 1,4-beta-cellobiosidase
MDIWEANSNSEAYTPHVCSVVGQYRCSGVDCGDDTDRYNGVCDKDGCDFNSYRMGDPTFLGPGKTVDTTKKFTVVTQFITDSGTATGNLVEIRRVYVQNNVVINNSKVNFPGLMTAYDSVTDPYCNDQKTLFGDTNSFETRGGLKVMGDSFAQGMVLVMSLWDDHAANMLWLDSDYPTTGDLTKPGVARGACATTSGVPADVEKNSPNSSVIFSNIKYGDIGSTYSHPNTGSSTTAKTTTTTARTTTTTARTTTTTPRTTTTTTANNGGGGGGAAHWAQCGGQ